jgi:hypothetical protein
VGICIGRFVVRYCQCCKHIFLGKLGRRKSSSHGNGLECTRRDLDLAMASAQVHVRAVRMVLWRRLHTAAQEKKLKSLAIFRNYDATPLRVSFGSHTHDVAPFARYFVLDGGKWKSHRFDSYVQVTGRKPITEALWNSAPNNGDFLRSVRQGRYAIGMQLSCRSSCRTERLAPW